MENIGKENGVNESLDLGKNKPYSGLLDWIEILHCYISVGEKWNLTHPQEFQQMGSKCTPQAVSRAHSLLLVKARD